MKYYARELSTIAAVLANLRQHRLILDSPEERLVVEALRRSNTALHDASLMDLGDYVGKLDDRQLQGLANNIKGIYHELLYVEQFNATHSDEQAELQSSTNHPGSDVVIRDTETGDVMRELQLKATDNLHYLTPHSLRYPNIELLASAEVAEQSDRFGSSGIFNTQLESSVNHQFDQLDGFSSVGQGISAATTSTLVAGGLRALECLSGKTSPTQAIGRTAADAAIATGTTAFVAFLFS